MEHDDLLDAAIAAYADVEMPERLPGRVLRQLRANRSRWLYIIVPLAASWLFVVWTPRLTESLTLPVFAPSIPAVGRHYGKPATVRVARSHRKTSARALSAQERAQILWVDKSPNAAVAEWAAARERWNHPLSIENLAIQQIKIEEIAQ